MINMRSSVNRPSLLLSDFQNRDLESNQKAVNSLDTGPGFSARKRETRKRRDADQSMARGDRFRQSGGDRQTALAALAWVGFGRCPKKAKLLPREV